MELTERQRETIQLFLEITLMSDENEAVRILTRHGWDLDSAVETCLGGGAGASSTSSSNLRGSSTSNLRSRIGTSTSASGASNAAQRTPSPHVNSVLSPSRQRPSSPPRSQRQTSSSTHNSHGASQGAGLASWRRMLWFGETQQLSHEEEVRKFVAKFEKDYGRIHPNFLVGSYKDAVSQASSDFRFLLAYLHCDIHEETPKFCKSTLCNETLVSFLDENVLFWGASVTAPDAFGVADALGCPAYPFMALLSCTHRGVTVIEKFVGPVVAGQIINRVTAATARYREQHEAARRHRQSMEESRRLREEQDAAYQAALEADQKREAEELAAREKQEQEAREEEERIAREAAEKEATENARREAIETKRRRLLPDPSIGEKGNSSIRFHLPNGSRLEKKFPAGATLANVRDFLDVSLYDKSMPIANYELATNFPRRVYETDSDEKSLAELGLSPQALLYVQDLDT